ncbi:FAD-dependent oxidoreductase [Streptomyces sp. NPDC056948]|uniref:FAD-dependent oxidoreductase n=1 Tax=Streptomyces sp. NPDC056948 TaxID=3345975 RepID=UPI00363A4A29
MAGLATAWFLQEAGVEVTVVDRRGVAAGASWGNAGRLSPALTVPLPEPAALKLGLRTLLSPPPRSTSLHARIHGWPASGRRSPGTAPAGAGRWPWPLSRR